MVNIAQLLYFFCILGKLNDLSLSLQNVSFNILTVNNKIKAFKKKIQHWTDRVESGRMDIFLS